jgi:DNA-binding NarL/FixJ family response regulator
MDVRILIVDDHEILREGICNLLARSGKSWEVCGQASHASDAMAAIKSLRPDVVVLAVGMSESVGWELLAWTASSMLPPAS